MKLIKLLSGKAYSTSFNICFSLWHAIAYIKLKADNIFPFSLCMYMTIWTRTLNPNPNKACLIGENLNLGWVPTFVLPTCVPRCHLCGQLKVVLRSKFRLLWLEQYNSSEVEKRVLHVPENESNNS